MEKVRFFDRQDPPQQALDSVRVLRSQYGKRQMVMSAPVVTMYSVPERKTVYPKGLKMKLYDGKKLLADFTADYAVSFDEKNIVEVRDNVVVIDYRTGDTSYLKSLVWNSSLHTIYSKDPVKSVNGPRVTYGDGFESDENFNTPYIIHQRGTMTFEDD